MTLHINPDRALVGIGSTIAKALESLRNVFCRDAGFAHIRRYISGLLLSPNKTLQGIYSQVEIADSLLAITDRRVVLNPSI